MKKCIVLILSLVLLCTACGSATPKQQKESANTYTSVEVPKITRILFGIGSEVLKANGQQISIKAPFIFGDVTFVPIRAIVEAFGAEVGWNDATQEVSIQKDDITISMVIGSGQAKVNGATKELAAPPQLHHDTTMVPLRFISETLGADVLYDEVKNQVAVVLRKRGEARPVDKKMLDEIKLTILKKTETNAKRFGNQFPEGTVDGVYNIFEKPNWVGGFYTGLNYLAYDMSADKGYITSAKKVFPTLTDILYNDTEYYHHDLGFTFMLSYYQDYLKTGSEDSKKVVIDAADALMARIQPLGYIRGWNVWGKNEFARNNQYRMIVDSMCNIPILFTATELTGDQKYYNAAVKQAKLTQQYLVRDDYSTTHTFVFSPNGTPLFQQQFQGYSDTSCWARGHSWVINGMAIAYEKTGDKSFLDTAKNCADTYFMMTDTDLIPKWDMFFQNSAAEPKDTSAASITACGLMDIWEATGDAFYKDIAYDILTVLYERYSSKDDPKDEGLINQAVGHKPAGKNINCALIYGDYYFAQLEKRFLDLE